jgi:hypothetical protein
MKMVLAIPGAIIVVFGVLLLSTPSILGQVAGYTGLSTTNTISPPLDKLVVVQYGNSTFFVATIPKQGTLSATFKSNPAGLNIFVMDQGNYTLFHENETAYPAVSLLNVSTSASLTETYNSHWPNSTYYFVIQNNSPAKQPSDVLIHYTITSVSVSSVVSYIPLIVVVVGLALLVVGGLPKGTKPDLVVQKPRMQMSTANLQAGVSPAQVTTRLCKFCGAAMHVNETFCPSCKKAQG